ncbi:acyl-CoA reductase [soil metagenome]
MTITERKNHFIQLGKFIALALSGGQENDIDILQVDLLERLDNEIESARHYNGWFTRDNVVFSLEQWSNALTEENLDIWLDLYDLPKDLSQTTVGIIMAGNIPLVGMHDFVSVLISGHNVLVKQSSNDQRILPLIAEFLIALNPIYKSRIRFTDGRMENFDAVIATGSNNTARYFEYYFANKPSIIRKNRNSVAILTGSESAADLRALGEDIFRYFGLGCRNVSKLYVPKDYDFDSLYKALAPWEHLMDHAKYANNYDYNKAVYLMSEFKFLDNGFLILKESSDFGSPIATLFYEKYENEEQLQQILLENKERLQCSVGSREENNVRIPFGKSQHPYLWEYADNVDTLAFLVNL